MLEITMPRSTAAVVSCMLLVCVGLGGALFSSPLHALDKEALEASLRGPGRDVADRIRDPVRKPVEVLDFLGLESGMTVMDLYAAGGYFTWVLSKAVGPDGVVYAQNTPRGLSFGEDRTEMTQGEALAMKIEAGNLTNVVRVDRPVADLGLASASVDFVLISQILHDYHNGNPQRALNMLQQVHEILKPGGIVGIIDHVGMPGLDNRRMHRMLKEDAIRVIEEAGFVVEAESDLLANPNDNYRRSIFDPMLNRSSDQFLLRVRKPI
ncbi:MAG: methyltransferase domain-containing protein [Gammaproteobacteria bacterium]|nr:methyltransferase domain-containing protein [Gammaproteobacteria bacterium]